ncbi:solute carrier family 22 member 13-like [Dendropsophus ebraccatus]|uniref:solute carrier family 22 member 13-like n=1 Tax=Dendropsophus ebraccatus TaxID=150705 RepID=UPI003831CADA
MTDFGEVLKNVGEFGRFQKCLVFMLCFLSFFNAFHMFGQVFLEISVPHHCNTNWILQISPNLTEDIQLNLTIPQNERGIYEQCRMYTPVDWDIEYIERYGLNDTEDCQDGWVYDTSQQKSTLVTEFDLVCHRKDQTELCQSIFMLGILIGSLIFGSLGDRIGRRPVLLISILFMVAFGLGAAFVTEFYAFIVLRCFVGIGTAGIMLNNLALVAEWVGPSQRAYATITVHVCFAIGLMALAGTGYAIRNWRLLQIVCSAPTAILALYIWFLPESARWLLTKGKNEKAKDLLQKAARMNKREISEDILQQLQEKKPQSGNMIDLFRIPTLRKRALIGCLVWFANSLVYYGLSMNVGSFGLDIYLTQLIFGAVEIPARLGAMFAVQLIGRRLSQSLYLLLGGTACLLITAIPKGLSIGVTVLAVIGKFATASSYSVCYIYAAELFPTILRQNGVGLCSMSARLGGIIAPLVILLDRYHPAIPMAIYGSVPIIGGLLCFLLPETKGRELEDLKSQANNIPRSDSLTKNHILNDSPVLHTEQEKSTWF